MRVERVTAMSRVRILTDLNFPTAVSSRLHSLTSSSLTASTQHTRLSSGAAAMSVANNRRRSSSVQKVLQHVTSPPADHRLGAGHFAHTASTDGATSPKSRTANPWDEPSHGFWDDLVSMRWMRHPGSSLRIIAAFVFGWAGYELLRIPLKLTWSNPVTPFLVISYPLQRQWGEADVRYGKGLKDVAFLAFYVVVFSFLRQFLTGYIIQPYAKWLGLRGTKAQRFVDQGYAVFYWGSASVIGLIVMSKQPTWWYNTPEFWKSYPHWRMEPTVKVYYLLQFAYWLQQMLLLGLKLEKPRSDFLELCIHHCVTLWIVGWSYTMNLTYIGTAMFVSMDVPDVFLGISKCINYTKYQRTSEISFIFFLGVWTYLRHWENYRILASLYYEYDVLVPKHAQRWAPADKVFLPPWMKWQLFMCIFVIQLLNLFWYYLIWRIVFRLLLTGQTNDVREEGDDDGKEE